MSENTEHPSRFTLRRSSRTRQPRQSRSWPPRHGRTWLLAIGAVALILLAFAASRAGTPSVTNVNFSTFINKVDANQVATATVDPNGKVTGQMKGGQLYSSQVPLGLGDSQLTSTLEQHGVSITGVGPSTSAVSVVLYLLPVAFVVGLMVLFGRQTAKGTTNVSGKTTVSRVSRPRANLYDGERPRARFGDVAGYGGAKMEVSEVVDFLAHPERYAAAGAVGPRGVLMVGPPGTGKTLLARAVAGEAEVPFFATTGSSFVELFVGMGASRVRELFAKARQHAPSIVFIDELDAVGGKRGAGLLAGNDEREQTLNELLAAMDGFDPATGVVVVAATNRPESLDPALLRPGRFDRTVEIPLPNVLERAAILRAHTKGRKLGPSVDLEVVARLTPGFSGADLANLMNEAAIVAVRAGRQVVSAHDFSEVRDRLLLGRRESSTVLGPEEKIAVAVHEAGHATVAALSEHADPVEKVTILPAGSALGVTQQMPVDERHLYTESYLLDSLAVRLGGRAAEILALGEPSSGASNDLAGATELAGRMVRDFGMSSKLGPLGFANQAPDYLGGAGGLRRAYSEGTQQLMDEEIARLLREAEQRALALLTDHRQGLDHVVDLLLEQETIDGLELETALVPPGSGVVEDRVAAATHSPARGRRR